MELWHLSDIQVKTLLAIRDKDKDGVHKSIIKERTLKALLTRKLIKPRRACRAYMVLTSKGKEIIRRVS
jgi:hypothetical protein